ncbi:hypothetical protein GQ53DRAFT_377481 [Thozetella sp. PMI_491]|nr:hypothetical protein GQ53DRAFT_377481 [Thozetella sp. PMI_491]
MLGEVYASCLSSITQCCGTRERSRPANEKQFVALRDHHPPALAAPPAAHLWPQERQYGRRQEGGRAGSRKISASRGAVAGRKGWFSSSSSRRPQISAPSDFRHLHSGAYQFSPVEPVRRLRPTSFRPLELSLYLPENEVSPILPHFGDLEDLITPPPQAYTQAHTPVQTPMQTWSEWDGNSTTLTHERSYSSMSFHYPRRQNTNGSTHSQSPNVSPPSIPPRARARQQQQQQQITAAAANVAAAADDSPSISRIVERIASAIIERDRIQDEIDSILERQSIYAGSRPSTAHDMHDIEPVPSIPALPAAGPSFAERLSTESHSRPPTAVAQPNAMPRRDRVLSGDALAGPRSSNQMPPYTRMAIQRAQFKDERPLDMPLAPPLPLVLRPPLRKKKSFSRVSNWLFPAEEEHGDNIGLDAMTSIPKPVTGRDGFYAPIEGMTRTSVDTVSSVSSWESEEEEERQTLPTTTWSPGSSPTVKQGTPKQTPMLTPTMDRAVFVEESNAHRPTSVGVAF